MAKESSKSWASSPLLWEGRLWSLLSFLYPSDVREGFSTLLDLLAGRVSEAEGFYLVRDNKLGSICRDKAFALLHVVIGVPLFISCLSFYLSSVGGANPLVQFLYVVGSLLLFKYRIISRQTMGVMAILFSLSINAYFLVWESSEFDIPPFFLFFATFLPSIPIALRYNIQNSLAFCIIFFMNLAVLLYCFWASLGREYVINFSLERHIYLLPMVILHQLLATGYFTLFEAEVQVYDALFRRLLASLNDKNNAKTHFISRMSHELRTPLNGLLSSVGLLRQTRMNEEQETYLTIIESCGDLVLDIVFRILDIIKIESGRFESHTVDFNLFEVVGNVARSMASLAEAKGMEIGIHFDLDDEGYDVHGDKAHFHEILVNFTGNAVKYSDHGAISLSVSKRRVQGTTLYRIEVKDRGRGIAPDYLKWVFEPFAQVPDTLKKEEGTGLGLAISKKIAEAMGGSVGVESKVGVGSTFWMELPFRPLPPGTLHFALDRIPLRCSQEDGQGQGQEDADGEEGARELARRLSHTPLGVVGGVSELTRTVEGCFVSWKLNYEIFRGEAFDVLLFLRQCQQRQHIRHFLIEGNVELMLRLAKRLAAGGLLQDGGEDDDAYFSEQPRERREREQREEQEAPRSPQAQGVPHLHPHLHLHGSHPHSPHAKTQHGLSLGMPSPFPSPAAHTRLHLLPRPAAKIVFFSSLSDFSTVRRTVEDHSLEAIVTVIPKPMDPLTLLKALGRLVGFELDRENPGDSFDDVEAQPLPAAPAVIVKAPGAAPAAEAPAPLAAPDAQVAAPKHHSRKSSRDTMAEILTAGEVPHSPDDTPVQVLIVEDNKITQMLLKKQMEKLHVAYRVTGSAQEAVEIWKAEMELKGRGIPLILMDVEVDGPINGLEATNQIRMIEQERMRARREARREARKLLALGHTDDGSSSGDLASETEIEGGASQASSADLLLYEGPEEAQEPAGVDGAEGRTYIGIMTGRALESDRKEAEEAGGDIFLLKPVRIDVVASLVKKVIPVRKGSAC